MSSSYANMDWEPLPQRDLQSSRTRRRQARLADALNARKVAEEEAKPKRKMNRPGFNSYLKVEMDDFTLDMLHGMALKIRQAVEALPNATNDTPSPDETETTPLHEDANKPKNVDAKDSSESALENTDGASQPAVEADSQEKKGEEMDLKEKEKAADSKGGKSKKGNKRPLTFKPRSRASLHTTFFFGGETLCELSPAELTTWHESVRSTLEPAGFILDNQGENEDVNDDKFWFKCQKLSVFPPRRNNLVVAIFEASPAWHTLHTQVLDIAKKSPCTDLQEIAKSNKDKWTAHVTMGNIMGGTKAEIKNLSQLLQQIEKEGDASNNPKEYLFESHSSGIAMGGPVPKQVDLSWDFHFCPQPSTTSNEGD